MYRNLGWEMKAWIVRLPGEKSTEINHMQPSSSALLLKDLNLLLNSFHISLTRFYFKITWLFHSLWHFSFFSYHGNYDDDDTEHHLKQKRIQSSKLCKKKLLCVLRLECIDLITKTHDFVCVCVCDDTKNPRNGKIIFLLLLIADKRKAEATKRSIFHHTRLTQVWIE